MRLGMLLAAPCVVALQGEMGAGKTQFAKGFGLGWGASQLLRSPTFTLVQEHRREKDGQLLFHIDLYRAEREAEVRSLGLEEIFDDPKAISLVEWPERGANLIPLDALRVRIEIASDTKRQVTFSTHSGEHWRELLAFRKGVFGV
jgi:tRNA threonylcarbamoyladenosine biosynthesis protein TsaE